MKRACFAIVMLIALISLLVAGCGGDEATEPTAQPTAGPTATTEATETPAETAAPTQAPPTQAPPSGELSALLAKTADIKSVYFKMVMTAPGLPEDMTSEVWQKTGKTKTVTNVMGQTAVTYTDYDAQKMCTCFEATGTCMGMDFSQAPDDPVEQAELIEQYQPTIIGSETINGKECLVFQWSADGVDTKWWVDKKSGWPLRIESTSPEGTTVIEYTDIEFVDIPDSEFVFPAECETA